MIVDWRQYSDANYFTTAGERVPGVADTLEKLLVAMKVRENSTYIDGIVFHHIFYVFTPLTSDQKTTGQFQGTHRDESVPYWSRYGCSRCWSSCQEIQSCKRSFVCSHYWYDMRSNMDLELLSFNIYASKMNF